MVREPLEPEQCLLCLCRELAIPECQPMARILLCLGTDRELTLKLPSNLGID